MEEEEGSGMNVCMVGWMAKGMIDDEAEEEEDDDDGCWICMHSLAQSV